MQVLLGPNGKSQLSFDGAFLINNDTLLFVEAKHCVSKQDIDDLANKSAIFEARLRNVKDATAPQGSPPYQSQVKTLRDYTHRRVAMCIGGCMIDEEAVSKAHTKGCLIVRPSGGRYGVME